MTLEAIQGRAQNTLLEHLGIEFFEIGEDFLKARMPVDHRTKQTTGILHGGASAALAETLGSIAASYCIDREKKRIVGLELNANHIRPVTEGWVTGVAKPIHIGNTTQVWEIRIMNSQQKLVCISRLTVANVEI
jgi:1,4-dihydroxy-2-naphthoyl-CoA hydrolase